MVKAHTHLYGHWNKIFNIPCTEGQVESKKNICFLSNGKIKMTTKMQPFFDVSSVWYASNTEGASMFTTLWLFHKRACVSKCPVGRRASMPPPSHIVQEALRFHSGPGSFSECQARRKLGCLVPCSGLLVAVPLLRWRWFSRVPRRFVLSVVNLLPQASLRTSWAQASEPQCHYSTKHSLCARIDGSTELFRSPCNKISLLLTNPLPVGNVQSHHFRP